MTLWKRRPDGSAAVQLTFAPMHIELPRWSPNGQWIAFSGIRPGDGVFRVYVIPAGGGEPQEVLHSSNPQGAPTWSPDGKQIAFGNLRDASGGFPKSTAIHIVDLTSHVATTVPGSNGLWTARWSPDGRHMAALTTDIKTLKIFDFRTNRWQVAATAGSINDLNWNRKGDALYFLDVLPSSGPTIYCVRLEEHKVEEVTALSGSNPIRSTWLGLAPDDSLLISNFTGTSEIYALNVNWP